jgi:hypothetical protein
MWDFAAERVRQGLPMPGVFLLPQRLRQQIGAAIDALALPIELSETEDWRDQVVYLPL